MENLNVLNKHFPGNDKYQTWFDSVKKYKLYQLESILFNGLMVMIILSFFIDTSNIRRT